MASPPSACHERKGQKTKKGKGEGWQDAARGDGGGACARRSSRLSSSSLMVPMYLFCTHSSRMASSLAGFFAVDGIWAKWEREQARMGEGES